jgi:hypothetical protein
MLLGVAIIINIVQLVTFYIMNGMSSVLTSTIFMAVAVLVTIPVTSKQLRRIDESIEKRSKKTIT